jgi:hypothetical protein
LLVDHLLKASFSLFFSALEHLTKPQSLLRLQLLELLHMSSVHLSRQSREEGA